MLFSLSIDFFKNVLKESRITSVSMFCELQQVIARLNNTLVYDLNLAIVIAKSG